MLPGGQQRASKRRLPAHEGLSAVLHWAEVCAVRTRRRKAREREIDKERDKDFVRWGRYEAAMANVQIQMKRGMRSEGFVDIKTSGRNRYVCIYICALLPSHETQIVRPAAFQAGNTRTAACWMKLGWKHGRIKLGRNKCALQEFERPMGALQQRQKQVSHPGMRRAHA